MEEQLEQREINYMRGKVAEMDVRDDQNNVIVAHGQTINDDLISKARAKGRLHYLMLAAAASIVQAGGDEADRRMKEFKDVTEGHEIEFVRGKLAGCDVLDRNGNILIHKDEQVTDDIIQKVDNLGLLQDLVLAVGAPGIHSSGLQAQQISAKMGYTPYQQG